jgi:hypothetical protein
MKHIGTSSMFTSSVRGADQSTMNQGGYSPITTQSETTKTEGRVDHGQIRQQLKNGTIPRLANRIYAYPTASTLAIRPREIVFLYRHKLTKFARNNPTAGVVSSLNGAAYSDYPNDDCMMRDICVEGVSKTDIPIGEAPGGRYADQTGIAYLMTGTITLRQNSGPGRIVTGDLWAVRVPPTVSRRLTAKSSLNLKNNRDAAVT